MSISAQSKPVSNWREYASSYAELTKLRISVMVLFTFVVTGILSAGLSVNLLTLFYASLGMILIAGSGNAMNMYLERYTDVLMPRTANRPLPARKLSSTEVVVFAAVCLGVSLGIFVALVNWQTAVCGLATWFLYVWVYTPLKTRTPLNTEIGAVAGAMPILMGALATTGTVDWIGWSFFIVLLIWQFPHFMAIAWMYREQYRDGGLKMLTVVDPTGHRAGRKAVWTCIALIAASLLPMAVLASTVHMIVFAILALVLGSHYMRASLRFAGQPDDMNARNLLKSSVLYLPMYMLVVVISCLV